MIPIFQLYFQDYQDPFLHDIALDSDHRILSPILFTAANPDP